MHHIILRGVRTSVREQLDAEEIYKDGPFDVLFMLGGGRTLWRQLQSIFPVFTIGWEDHPLAKRFRLCYDRQEPSSAHSLHTCAEYAACFKKFHNIDL